MIYVLVTFAFVVIGALPFVLHRVEQGLGGAKPRRNPDQPEPTAAADTPPAQDAQE